MIPSSTHLFSHWSIPLKSCRILVLKSTAGGGDGIKTFHHPDVPDGARIFINDFHHWPSDFNLEIHVPISASSIYFHKGCICLLQFFLHL
jgi:hypothetical protein